MKKFLPYISLVGWLLVAGFSLVLYPAYFKAQCSFESSWIFCNTPLSNGLKVASVALIFVFIVSLVLSGYGIWKNYYVGKHIFLWFAGVCMLLAIFTVTFGSSDTSYYFSAGKAAATGLNPVADTWVYKRDFVNPVKIENVTGFSYGPIMVHLFRGVYTLSSDNPAIFILIWKIFLVLIFISTGWAAYRILKLLDQKISNKSFMLFWVLQPLILLESLVNGHFDILWLLCILLALLAALQHRWWLVIPLLITGIWVKFLPILVTPFFVVWWWQELTKSTWKKYLVQTFLGMFLGALVTYICWYGLWPGFKAFDSIAAQSKWAVDSIFALVYYSLKPLFVWVLGDRAHWFLTRFVQGGLVVLMIYLLWPYLKKIVLTLLKKTTIAPQMYLQIIFFSLLVYLSLWQKSFWPWYVVWIVPLGVVIYTYTRNVLFGRLILWLSIAPLSFYPIWLVNWYVRGVDATAELWFYWVFVSTVWAYPLYVLVKLRKVNFNL